MSVGYSKVGKNPILEKDGVVYELQYNSNNGNVQIQSISTPTDPLAGLRQPIYFDGRFTPSANIIGLTDAEQKNLHTQVQSLIREAHNAAGGTSKGAILPVWARSENQGSDPGETGFGPSSVPDPNNPLGNIIESGKAIISAVTNPSQAIQNISVINKDYSVGNEQIFREFALKYPIDMRSERQDHVKISQYEYIPPNAKSIFSGSEQIWTRGLFRGTDFNKEKLIGIVTLPMPNTVADSNSVFWQDDSINNMTAGAAANVMENMAGYLGAAGLGGVGGAGAGNAQGGANLGVSLAGLAALVTSGAYPNNESLQAMLGTDVVKTILNMQGRGIEPETILARGAGVIPNSNMEFLFKGVVLRTFDNFSWRMTARSPQEAKVIRRIIRFFKQGMAARKFRGKSGSPSFMLGTPNVFRLSYDNGQNIGIDALNKFKTCALTKFTTDYTPDKFWAAYDQGQPLSIAISMSFTELEPIYNTDYQENNIFDGRDDLQSITPNMVGY
jgi:hypothetical protein